MSGTITGPCVGGCGTTVVRARAASRMLNSLPLWCDLCIVRDRKQEERDAAERGLVDRLRRSGLPAHHRRELADLEHGQELVDGCRDWADGEIRGLLLTGPIGVGKTTLAGTAAWRMLARRGLLWVPVSLLFARLASSFDSEQHRWALEALSGGEAIVLDDLDKTRPSEYAAEQAFGAIDRRVELEVPLLVTTNLTVSGLAERWPEPWGEAIGSRLVGYCRVMEVAGADRRLESIEVRGAA